MTDFPSTSTTTNFSEPSNLSGRQLVGKVAMGLLIGGVISALLFVVLSFMSSMFTAAMGQQTGGLDTSASPLLPFILLFIGFISTFIGNLAVGGVYSLFFSRKYYDASKMFSILFLTNGILFFILAPIYLIFGSQIETLFILMGFHVMFSVFVSAAQIEFAADPNYSASSMMGNVLGFALAFLVYGAFYKSAMTSDPQQKIYLFMLLPAILGYGLIPLGASIREKIYYKAYELGNNGLYIASPADVIADAPEETSVTTTDDINVG